MSFLAKVSIILILFSECFNISLEVIAKTQLCYANSLIMLDVVIPSTNIYSAL